MAYDVISLGELLVDFTPAGASDRGNSLYECNPGGGVANFAVAAAKAGCSSAFIGKVGNDAFGHVLAEAIASYGVDTAGLRFSDEYQTTLAFVHLNEATGERGFTFYRRQGADAMISDADIDRKLFVGAKAFHVSSLTMTTHTGYLATHNAVLDAKKQGIAVTYDPNLRPRLWETPSRCRETLHSLIPETDILKLSEEEMAFLFGSMPEEKVASHVLSLGPSLLVLTEGSKGCRYFCNDFTGQVCAFPAAAVDTTGAGDCFFGNLIAMMIQSDIPLVGPYQKSRLEECLRYASAAAALSVQTKGAMPSMPSPRAVTALMAK
ncbi:MAG: carbohydrate kinase [Eubacteriales bacterium]|nr:carbohydrate kinase [Eubacteriales bacterium]